MGMKEKNERPELKSLKNASIDSFSAWQKLRDSARNSQKLGYRVNHLIPPTFEIDLYLTTQDSECLAQKGAIGLIYIKPILFTTLSGHIR